MPRLATEPSTGATGPAIRRPSGDHAIGMNRSVALMAGSTSCCCGDGARMSMTPQVKYPARSRTIGRPDRNSRIARPGTDPGEPAAVGPDGPDLVHARSDPSRTRCANHPATMRARYRGSCRRSAACNGCRRCARRTGLPVRPPRERDPVAVGRQLVISNRTRSPRTWLGRPGHRSRAASKGHAAASIDSRGWRRRGAAVAREREVATPRGRRGHRFRIAEDAARSPRRRYAPEVHRAAARAREIQVPPVRRPAGLQSSAASSVTATPLVVASEPWAAIVQDVTLPALSADAPVRDPRAGR